MKMNQKNSKISPKNKKIIIISIIFLLLLFVLTFVVYSYSKNIQKQTIRAEFFEKIQNNDLSFFVNQELYSAMIEKMGKNDYQSKSNINASTTMENNMFSKLDLSKFEFQDDFRRSNKNDKSERNIFVKYADNDLISFSLLQTAEAFGLKSDEIVNKYIGSSNQNGKKIAKKIFGSNINLVEFGKIKNFVVDREWIDYNNVSNSSTIDSYAKLIQNNTKPNNFSKKENVVLDMDSEQIETTEYTVELDATQVSNILNGVLEIVKNDEEIIPELVVNSVYNFDEEEDLDYFEDDIEDDANEPSEDESEIQEENVETNSEENEVEVPAEENNFNASIRIWSQNENVGTSDSTSTNSLNTIDINPTPVNTTITNETTTVTNNTISNNSTVAENTVVQEQMTEENQQPQVETITPEQVNPELQDPSNEVENQTEEYIYEDENVRRKGFIQVNEGGEQYLSSDENSFLVGENYEQTVQNLVKLIEKIDWLNYLSTGAKANCTQEDLINQFQKVISNQVEQNNSLIVKLYTSGNNAIKLNFEIPEVQKSVDFEIVSRDDSEKYLNVTYLVGEENNSNGEKISFYKKESDANVKNKISLNKINKNKINKKINLDLETKGTNSKQYNTNVSFSYSDSDGEFKMDIENSVNFELNDEIEDLNNDNCLFLDEILNEELKGIKQAIKSKIIEVLNEKNRSLNIIDMNNMNSIVQQTEQEDSQENSDEKNNAKQALIQAISNKMREYENNGNTLKIEDLENLEVPEYDVQVSISSNLAIITVNGYKFNLDSDFNLSDS